MFNFSALAETKPVNNNSYLKPYTINENVAIKSSEIKEGTSSNGNPWKCLAITFGNDEGTYTDSIFYLDEKDPSITKRSEVDASNGGKRELPHAWERTQHKIAAIGYAFFPESFEKFKTILGKIRTFEEFMAAFKKMVDASVDKTTTSMKLVGRNSGGRVYATLPNCTGIAQATDAKRAESNGVNVGDWYTWMISPFGDKLFFSAYEETQRTALENAKPTPMSADPLLDTKEESNDDFDLENLL